MKRRSQNEINSARKLSANALKSLSKDNKHPGFDYVATLKKLNTPTQWFEGYAYSEIAEFCGYSSTVSIKKIIDGTMIPLHPNGELIYILYCETFKEKPPNTKLRWDDLQ